MKVKVNAEGHGISLIIQRLIQHDSSGNVALGNWESNPKVWPGEAPNRKKVCGFPFSFDFNVSIKKLFDPNSCFFLFFGKEVGTGWAPL